MNSEFSLYLIICRISPILSDRDKKKTFRNTPKKFKTKLGIFTNIFTLRIKSKLLEFWLFSRHRL